MLSFANFVEVAPAAPPSATSTSKEVEKCREMSRNVEKCRKMSSFVEFCRILSKSLLGGDLHRGSLRVVGGRWVTFRGHWVSLGVVGRHFGVVGLIGVVRVQLGVVLAHWGSLGVLLTHSGSLMVVVRLVGSLGAHRGSLGLMGGRFALLWLIGGHWGPLGVVLSFRNILPFCNIKVIFKTSNRLSSHSKFKDSFSQFSRIRCYL